MVFNGMSDKTDWVWGAAMEALRAYGYNPDMLIGSRVAKDMDAHIMVILLPNTNVWVCLWEDQGRPHTFGIWQLKSFPIDEKRQEELLRKFHGRDLK